MKILLKRGLITDIEKLILDEGEPAIAYNEDKSTAQLYVGGEGTFLNDLVIRLR